MKRIFLLCLILASCSLSGCVYMLFPSKLESLGNKKPFSGLYNKQLRLIRVVKVYDGIFCDGLDEKESDSVRAGGVILRITFTDEYGKETVNEFYKVPKELPQGTQIKFLDFRVNKDYYLLVLYKIRYTATFKVIGNPEISEDLEFEYIWGRGLYLNRAPWEDNSVPESRYVGFSGTSYSGE